MLLGINTGKCHVAFRGWQGTKRDGTRHEQEMVVLQIMSDLWFGPKFLDGREDRSEKEEEKHGIKMGYTSNSWRM